MPDRLAGAVLSIPYAAIPSMHVAFALVVATSAMVAAANHRFPDAALGALIP